MYVSTNFSPESTIRAWRTLGDPDIWIGTDDIGKRLAWSITPAEAQQLIAELQRELAAIEAEARGAAA